MSHRVFKTIICVLLVSISGHGQTVTTKSEAAWSACAKSNECVVVGPACGEAKAINKKYQEAYEAKQGPSPLECNQPPPFKTHQSVCKNSVCTIQNSQTK